MTKANGCHIIRALRGVFGGREFLLTKAVQPQNELRVKIHRLATLAAVFGFALLSAPASRATLYEFDANLNGPSESPPNASPGTGSVTVFFDTTGNSIRLDATFSGLLGTDTEPSIRTPTPTPDTGTAGAAIAPLPGFPQDVTSGTYAQILDLTQAGTYNPAYITANGGTTAGAEAALLASMVGGTAYFEINSRAFPGGEIRGFFGLTPSPEPGTWALMGVGAAMVGFVARRRRHLIGNRPGNI